MQAQYVMTECAACGDVIQVAGKLEAEPLCKGCTDYLLAESYCDDVEGAYDFPEQPGSTCSSGCGWCGRCS